MFIKEKTFTLIVLSYNWNFLAFFIATSCFFMYYDLNKNGAEILQHKVEKRYFTGGLTQLKNATHSNVKLNKEETLHH